MTAALTLPPHKPAGYLSPAACARCAEGWREELALQLETMSDAAARVRRLREVIVATGGTWVEPPLRGSWGPAFFEISLGGVTGYGDSSEAAVADWIAAVIRIARQDPRAPK